MKKPQIEKGEKPWIFRGEMYSYCPVCDEERRFCHFSRDGEIVEVCQDCGEEFIVWIDPGA